MQSLVIHGGHEVGARDLLPLRQNPPAEPEAVVSEDHASSAYDASFRTLNAYPLPQAAEDLSQA